MNKIALIAAATFAPMMASAATINVSIFDAVSYNGTYGIAAVTEDFEQLGTDNGEGQVTSPFQTALGTFSTLSDPNIAGSAGSGGTVTGGSQPAGNTGTDLALRNGNVFGRTNTTPNNGVWFLDSNDTWGMRWEVGLTGGTSFSALAFSLMDASDTGAFLRITAGTTTHELRTGDKLSNGNTKLVEIDFGGLVSSATVELGNYTTSGGNLFKRNDGFSVDGLQVFVEESISEVPLPASALLLGAAVAGFGAMRRRKQAQ